MLSEEKSPEGFKLSLQKKYQILSVPVKNSFCLGPNCYFRIHVIDNDTDCGNFVSEIGKMKTNYAKTIVSLVYD